MPVQIESNKFDISCKCKKCGNITKDIRENYSHDGFGNFVVKIIIVCNSCYNDEIITEITGRDD
jgi:hypothetical protein